MVLRFPSFFQDWLWFKKKAIYKNENENGVKWPELLGDKWLEAKPEHVSLVTVGHVLGSSQAAH